MSVFTVWVQPIDDYTTPENIDKYGSVHDVLSEYENDEGGTPNKQFCDGQTSKTPPRYAQDRMIGIYTRSDEAAQIISNALRQDVAQRVLAGELTLVTRPAWLVSIIGEAVVDVAAFVPALTKEEAVGRIQELGGGDTRMLLNTKKMSLDDLNDILEATEVTIGRHPVNITSYGYTASKRANAICTSYPNGTSKITVQRPYLADATAGAERASLTLVENKRMLTSNIEIINKQLETAVGSHRRSLYGHLRSATRDLRRYNSSPGWSVSDFSGRPLYTTYVHESYHAIYYKYKLDIPWLQASQRITQDMRLGVSMYARTNRVEFFAEVGAAIESGMTVDPAILEAFNKVLEGAVR